MGGCMSLADNSVISSKLKPVKESGQQDLKNNYHMGAGIKRLGKGAFGEVFLTHHVKNKAHQVAIKRLTKKSLQGHMEMIEEEIKILTKLDHPNIVKYYETY